MSGDAILARIWREFLDNGLDEARPEWYDLPDRETTLNTVIYEGRGGKELIYLRDCKEAYDRCLQGV